MSGGLQCTIENSAYAHKSPLCASEIFSYALKSLPSAFENYQYFLDIRRRFPYVPTLINGPGPYLNNYIPVGFWLLKRLISE